MALRNLILILGDQLDRHSAVFDSFEPERDALWMAEASHESTQVWSTKARIAIFLAAMRRLRDELIARGQPLHYGALNQHPATTLEAALAEDLRALAPQRVLCVRPGEWRLTQSLRAVCAAAGIEWVEVADRHFLCDHEEFAAWAKGRREFRLEHFYRWLRRREGVLLEVDGEPVGGQWNFDADNRGAFDRRGPGLLPAPQAFPPSPSTREALAEVSQRFADHPGSLDDCDWPLTPIEAEQALADFIRHRLPLFGRYQDAMWTAEPWLYHARLSAALNLKLIHPRRVIDAAVAAWEQGQAPLAAVEGFVRQILGWREFVRGLYWQQMPAFLDANALGAEAPLPDFYWTGATEMACLHHSLAQTLRYGYAHHIQRLMVLGLFAQLLGVRPVEIHRWFLAVYVDAVEWVELPNVLGMSQYADGGRMVSKPYVASGAYIKRMSNYCEGCRFRPEQAVGERACPFTTLYWDFLQRHQARFARHPRTALQWKSLLRKSEAERAAIAEQAAALRARLDVGSACSNKQH